MGYSPYVYAGAKQVQLPVAGVCLTVAGRMCILRQAHSNTIKSHLNMSLSNIFHIGELHHVLPAANDTP